MISDNNSRSPSGIEGIEDGGKPSVTGFHSGAASGKSGLPGSGFEASVAAPEKPKKSSKMVFIGVIVLVAVIALAIIGFVMVPSSSNSSRKVFRRPVASVPHHPLSQVARKVASKVAPAGSSLQAASGGFAQKMLEPPQSPAKSASAASPAAIMAFPKPASSMTAPKFPVSSESNPTAIAEAVKPASSATAESAAARAGVVSSSVPAVSLPVAPTPLAASAPVETSTQVAATSTVFPPTAAATVTMPHAAASNQPAVVFPPATQEQPKSQNADEVAAMHNLSTEIAQLKVVIESLSQKLDNLPAHQTASVSKVKAPISEKARSHHAATVTHKEEHIGNHMFFTSGPVADNVQPTAKELAESHEHHSHVEEHPHHHPVEATPTPSAWAPSTSKHYTLSALVGGQAWFKSDSGTFVTAVNGSKLPDGEVVKIEGSAVYLNGHKVEMH